MQRVPVIRRVLVDVTAARPGGRNGGALIFIRGLIREMARAHPETEFVLASRAGSESIFASHVPGNVHVHPVLPASAVSAVGGLDRTLGRLLEPLPRPWRLRMLECQWSVMRAAQGLLGRSRRSVSADADVLLCPFTSTAMHRRGTPTVCVVYDLLHADLPEFLPDRDVALRTQVLRAAVRRSARIAVISNAARDRLLLRHRTDPRRVCAIPHAIETSLHAAPARPVREFPQGSAPYLLYPANHWPHKNHDLLLVAWGMARARLAGRDLRLVLTGDPLEQADVFDRSVRRLGLSDSVHRLGFVDREEMAGLLCGATGLLFPSLHEGYGLPVAEAMQAGVPVLCSDIPALREVAGDAAIHFDPRRPSAIADAIVRVATDASLQARLRASGRSRAASLPSERTVAEQYWRLMVEAVSESGRG